MDQEQLKVGSKLPSERKLAAMLNVSRPSLREVLRALGLLGIVKPKQGEGTYLTISPRDFLMDPHQSLVMEETLDVVELAEARALIEPIIASLVATRASEEDLASLRQHLDGMRENLQNYPQFMHHDHQFHLCLIGACGNSLLRRMMLVLIDTLFHHRQMVAQVLAIRADLRELMPLHQRILDAVCRRNARAAHLAMVNHMKLGIRDTREWVGKVAFTGSLNPRRIRPESLQNLDGSHS